MTLNKSESRGAKRKDKFSGDIPSGAIEITKDTPNSTREDLVTSNPVPLPENKEDIILVIEGREGLGMSCFGFQYFNWRGVK